MTILKLCGLEIFRLESLPRQTGRKDKFYQELTYQDERRRGKKSKSSRIHATVIAETVENQTKETFEDASGEENGPERSGRIGWFSEFVDGNDCGGLPAAKHV